MKFLENLRIRSKLLFLYSALFICAISLSGGILYHIAGKSIEDQNEMELMNSTRSILNMVRTVARTSVKIHLKSIVMQNRRLVEYWYSLFHSGKLSEAEAKKMAGRSLLQMRIGTTGYIFVWDVREAPRRIPLAVHPVIQGSDVAYVDFVQKGAAMKNGYMEYEWANPGDTEKRKKSMYLSYFKPWEWVIAASSYKEEFLELVGADDFRDSILPMHFGRSGYSYVLDTRGNIIIHPKLSGNYYEARDTEGLYFVREMIKKKRGTIYYTWQNPGEPAPRKKMAVYDYIPENNWIVVSSSYQDEFKKPLMQLRAVIIITIAASFVLVLSLSFWIGSGIASPIHSLIERLSLGAKGDFTIRMNHETRDEIGELSSYFNSFMERLEHYEHDLKKEIRVRESTGDELKAVNLELVKTHEELALSNENLSAEKERLMITLRSIGDGVIATDRDGIVIMANPEAERMIDLGREGLVGSPVEEIVRLADENSGTPLPNPASSVIESGEPVDLRGDVVLVTAGGVTRNVLAGASPIRDGTHRTIGTVLVVRDVTERKRAERELSRAMQIESLGVFAGGIAHDFNNILTVIIGNISLAMNAIDRESGCYDILHEAEKASLNAKSLTQQLMTFSKGGEPIRVLTPVSDLLMETTEFILSGSSIRAEYRFSDDLWNAVVDPGQFSQVMYNIVLNARQAMPRGGTIHIAAENYSHYGAYPAKMLPGDYLLLSITDEGPGIPPEQRARIFDPYFTTKEDGTGLGLSICYSIILKHGGFMTADSVPGSGARLTIYLPASREIVRDASIHERVPTGGGGAILVMDDEEGVLKIAGRMLSELGYEAVYAKNGEEAIARYRDRFESGMPFRAVIMDLTVPGGMGGRDAVRILKEMDPGIRAIVSSGYSSDPVMANHEEYGFCGVIIKPYRFEDMAAVVHKLIGGE